MLDSETLTLEILCIPYDRRLSAAVQLCNSTIPHLPTLEQLTIDGDCISSSRWQNDIGAPQWLELLQSFTCVKGLIVSRKLVRLVAPALQELAGERVTEMSPVLQNIFLQGPRPSGAIKEAMEKFIAARQLSGYPVTMNVVGDSESGSMVDFGFDMDEVFSDTSDDLSAEAADADAEAYEAMDSDDD